MKNKSFCFEHIMAKKNGQFEMAPSYHTGTAKKINSVLTVDRTIIKQNDI